MIPHRIRQANNDKALAAFIAAKTDIDTMLARIKARSDDHFGVLPEDVHWGYVGNLTDYAVLLRRITDALYKEGEHAE